MSTGDHHPSRLENGFLPVISPRVARRQFQISVALVVVTIVGLYGLFTSLNIPRRPLPARPSLQAEATAPLLTSPVLASQ